ncbi:MAG: hypothetical protein HOV81_18540 [Kofleriaceae bacterium]|nr:hypothetical protein [Kofleriaceae bacterium]
MRVLRIPGELAGRSVFETEHHGDRSVLRASDDVNSTIAVQIACGDRSGPAIGTNGSLSRERRVARAEEHGDGLATLIAHHDVAGYMRTVWETRGHSLLPCEVIRERW